MTCDTTSTLEVKMGMQQPFSGEICLGQTEPPLIWQDVLYKRPPETIFEDARLLADYPEWMLLDNTMPLLDYPEWMPDALSKLETISQLPDDWDAYGSPSLPDSLYRKTFEFLRSLKTEFIPETQNIPAPFVIPVSGGGVQLEWHFQGRELEIEFIESNRVGYLKDHRDGNMEEGRFSPDDFDFGYQLIRWLATGKE